MVPNLEIHLAFSTRIVLYISIDSEKVCRKGTNMKPVMACVCMFVEYALRPSHFGLNQD